MSKSATTTEVELLKNPTPGDVLLEEFLKPIGMSQTALAHAIGVPPRRINEIVLGKRAVTADTDLRLTRYWGMSQGFFLRLQISHDLREQRRKIGPQLEMITLDQLQAPRRGCRAGPCRWLHTVCSLVEGRQYTGLGRRAVSLVKGR
jgi:antitoxin HigA-1